MTDHSDATAFISASRPVYLGLALSNILPLLWNCTPCRVYSTRLLLTTTLLFVHAYAFFFSRSPKVSTGMENLTVFWVVLNLIILFYCGLVQPIIEFSQLYDCDYTVGLMSMPISLVDPYKTSSSAAILVFSVLAVIGLLVILVWGKKIDVHRIRSFYKLDAGLLFLNLWVFVFTPFVGLICYGTLVTGVRTSVPFYTSAMVNTTLSCAALSCTDGGCYPGPASAVWFLVSIGLVLSIMILVGNVLLFIKFVVEASQFDFRTPGFKDATVLGKGPAKGTQLQGTGTLQE